MLKQAWWFLNGSLVVAAVAAFSGCGSHGTGDLTDDEQGAGGAKNPGGKADNADSYNEVNLAAGSAILYELQVRTANACHPDVGSSEQKSACKGKLAPKIQYRAQGLYCGYANELEKIKLGTLDDMLEDTADFRQGITVRYVNERVGANTLWLMPLFPNNDQWNLPDGCDNLGSPYAVRDYLHAAGTLSRACIKDNRDEYSSTPCWANDELKLAIDQAHSRGMRVMLDIAFNHFGHNYLMYDAVDIKPERERIAQGESLDHFWNFAETDDPSLLHPDVLDRPEKLDELVARSEPDAAALGSLKEKCPNLEGDHLIRAFNQWRIALDHERQQFLCEDYPLEYQVPGFYLGANAFDPSSKLGDNFTNNWVDVKFLFHHEDNATHQWEFVRNREYLFRILNYWVSVGVDGFRFDHTTDPAGGMGSKEWKYLVSKVDYYAWRRGQSRPIYLAEEFHDQMEMNKVVDIMTEGYVGDMCGRAKTKDAWHVESVIGNMDRFGDHVFVMSALETHDEHRLLDNTGFNIWTGAGFWGIGATTRSTPMMLVGQEFGEPWGLGFKRSDFLRSRFVGSDQYNPAADDLIGYYRELATQRLRYENRALLAKSYSYLRTKSSSQPDTRVFAMAKWSDDGNVMFVFHNLWETDVSQNYFISPELAGKMSLKNDRQYRLIDVITGQQFSSCRSGADLAWDFPVTISAASRALWLRLESCY